MTFGLALPDQQLLEPLGTDAPPLNGNDDSFVLVRGRLASGGPGCPRLQQTAPMRRGTWRASLWPRLWPCRWPMAPTAWTCSAC